MVDYPKILKKNMINVFKDVLSEIQKNGLLNGGHLYITFDTNNEKTKIANWLKVKYPLEMTIIIQHEYWNFKVKKNSFNISLSFDDIKTELDISYDAVISFADPTANFGLKLIAESIKKNIQTRKKPKKKKNVTNKNNIIEFKDYKKN